jgi:hypothetical protein
MNQQEYEQSLNTGTSSDGRFPILSILFILSKFRS